MHRWLTGFTAVTLVAGLVLAFPSAPPAAALTVTRLAGVSRDLTAVAVSQSQFPAGKAQAVVLASDSTFPDALAGTPLAAAKDGPLLLTSPSDLGPAVSAEISRALPRGRTVYVLGGVAAIAASVDNQLESMGYTVQRLAGPDRFATAVAIAAALGNPSHVLEATGLNFPDGLSAGAAAVSRHAAVLLTDGSAQSPDTATYLQAHPGTTYAIGGPAAAADPKAVPVVGSDRYATATLVAQQFFGSPNAAGFASGQAFPDALSGGANIAAHHGPLLLAPSCGPLPASLAAYLAATPTITTDLIYGGTSTLCDQLGTELAAKPITQPTPPAACVFASSPGATPAFCDSFSAPDATGNRAGQLDGTVWGTSRVSGNENIGAPADGWPSAQLSSCGSTALVNPPNDIQICNGQLVDTLNDGGTVASLAMYPKQPFDFAGRTGTITFDVSNDSQGNHEAWPELWVTDQPVPDPFGHEASWMAYPRNGFGIRFAGCTDSTGAPNTCTLGQNSVGVDSAIIIKNYAGNDSFSGGSLKVIGLGSVLKSGAGQVNHYEVQVSTNEIDIYATNPFTGTLNLANTPLVHIATIPNASLSFTRGLVWIEDVHYNGDKFGTQRLHSFFWENVGFDGPVLPRDLAFDVPDNTTPDPNINFTGIPGTDLGYYVAPNSSLNLTDPGVTGIAQASGGLLTFNFWELATPPITLTVAVNGNTISVPWAYPDDTAGSPRTLAVPIPLTDIQTGNNTITFTTGNYGLNVMNTDLILQGAGGTVNP